MTDATGHKGFFDTSGWYPKNAFMQKRMEDMVEYFATGKGKNNVEFVGLSLNPFHALNAKSHEKMIQGGYEGARRFQKLYVDRMASALYTFTPLFDDKRFKVLARAMSEDYDLSGFCSKKNLRSLINKILKNLESRYEKDLASGAKMVSSQSMITEKMRKAKELTSKIGYIAPGGRADALYNNKAYGVFDVKNKYGNQISDFMKNTAIQGNDVYKTIDVNGRVFATNFYYHVPTEIRLNFKNKSKLTVPMENVDFSVTNEMIERDFSKNKASM